MNKLNELRKARAALIDDMEKLLAVTEKEARDFTAEEETRYADLEAKLGESDQAIKSEEKKSERASVVTKAKEDSRKIVKATPISIGEGKEGEFRNFGEFIATLATDPSDLRLRELRVQQMKNGTSGGFAVPDQFREQLLKVEAQSATIRPRATVIPAGDPPDAELNMPALDQRASQNMYGGVIIYHQGESDSLTESTFNLRPITLKPKKQTGYMTSSNELLNNWDAASAVIPQLMRTAMTGSEDTDFLTGDGVNKAMGVINSPAAIQRNRTTANQISWADVYNMMARLKMGGSPVWIASQTIIPQLVQIADASSRAIWAPSAAPGIPPSLYGYPVLFNDRSPALGSKGDLVLADLSYYLIKDGSGPTIAVSEHFRFQNDEVAFRLTWNVDGQSWLNEPIALEGSTANTVSPFVVLNTP